jgi:hypothetical protein
MARTNMDSVQYLRVTNMIEWQKRLVFEAFGRCDKVTYPTKEKCENSVFFLKKTGKLPVDSHAYKCPHCGRFHVTTLSVEDTR